MTGEYRTHTAPLDLSVLRQVLNSNQLVCVVGYGLSEEASIPQFDAILKGVWSTAPRNIDPFGDARGRDTVLGWFNWRKQIINKKNRTEYFKPVLELRRALPSLVIATQCVDGQLRKTGLEEIHELYGNIFEGRCSQCGLEADINDDLKRCACNGVVFPDASMFDWNLKSEALKTIQAAAINADALILIGSDPSLAPLHELYSRGYAGQILVVLPNGFLLSDRFGIRKATAPELTSHYEKEHGTRIPVSAGYGIFENLKFLVQLVKTMHQDEQGLAINR